VAQEKSLVLYRVEDKVAVITLNRPEKMNAFNRALWKEFDAALNKAFDDEAVRVIAVIAEGRAFSAGADISVGEDPTQLLPWMQAFRRHFDRQFRMWSSEKIIIAGVHGYVLGRGLELALWCDIVIASEDAKFGQPEIREGFVVHSMVPWLTGPQQAKLFMLSGDTITAREAERLGLVARVVEEGAAAAEAIRLAKRLSHVPAVAASAVKAQINGVYETMGVRAEQAIGISASAVASGMTAAEKGIEELERIRHEQGLKASIKFRDAPFQS
jgi:enoyl-CoA hydratase